MLKIGDKVSFLNEAGGGIVTKILNKNRALVAIEEALEIPCLLSDLVKISTETTVSKTNFSKPFFKKDAPIVKKRIVTKKNKRAKTAIKQVDLHIEKLADNFEGMSNAEILNIQLNHFEYHLNLAITNKIPNIIFIHGIGSGVLKSAIRKILDNYSFLQYYDASYSYHGFGATEVVIK